MMDDGVWMGGLVGLVKFRFVFFFFFLSRARAVYAHQSGFCFQFGS